MKGFEPLASRMQTERSSKLNYIPIILSTYPTDILTLLALRPNNQPSHHHYHPRCRGSGPFEDE